MSSKIEALVIVETFKKWVMVHIVAKRIPIPRICQAYATHITRPEQLTAFLRNH